MVTAYSFRPKLQIYDVLSATPLPSEENHCQPTDILRPINYLGSQESFAIGSCRPLARPDYLSVSRYRKISAPGIRCDARPFPSSSHGRFRNDDRTRSSTCEGRLRFSGRTGIALECASLAKRLFRDSCS